MFSEKLNYKVFETIHVSAEHFDVNTMKLFQTVRVPQLQLGSFKAPNLSIDQDGGSPRSIWPGRHCKHGS